MLCTMTTVAFVGMRVGVVVGASLGYQAGCVAAQATLARMREAARHQTRAYLDLLEGLRPWVPPVLQGDCDRCITGLRETLAEQTQAEEG